jgi:hypothetical protein
MATLVIFPVVNKITEPMSTRLTHVQTITTFTDVAVVFTAHITLLHNIMPLGRHNLFDLTTRGSYLIYVILLDIHSYYPAGRGLIPSPESAIPLVLFRIGIMSIRTLSAYETSVGRRPRDVSLTTAHRTIGVILVHM